jgi:hypothetical protein
MKERGLDEKSKSKTQQWRKRESGIAKPPASDACARDGMTATLTRLAHHYSPLLFLPTRFLR